MIDTPIQPSESTTPAKYATSASFTPWRVPRDYDNEGRYGGELAARRRAGNPTAEGQRRPGGDLAPVTPYWALRSYQDGGAHYAGQIGSEPSPLLFLCALWAVMDQLWEVTKDTGSVFVNLGDKYAGSGGHNNSGISSKAAAAGGVKATRRTAPDSYLKEAAGLRNKSRMMLPHRFAEGCVDPDYRLWVQHRAGLYGPALPPPQWIMRMDAVWAKANHMPESVGDRVSAAHEYVFHLTKSDRYYADLDAIREDHSDLPSAVRKRRDGVSRPAHRGADADGHPARDRLGDAAGENPAGRQRGSVWRIPLEPLVLPRWWDGADHYAAYPTEIPRLAILGWCPPGGVVLDPFGGTGTTAMVARALGRYGVSLDLSADYLRLARWRVFDSGHWDRVIERTTGRRSCTAQQLPGQLSLLG